MPAGYAGIQSVTARVGSTEFLLRLQSGFPTISAGIVAPILHRSITNPWEQWHGSAPEFEGRSRLALVRARTRRRPSVATGCDRAGPYIAEVRRLHRPPCPVHHSLNAADGRQKPSSHFPTAMLATLRFTPQMLPFMLVVTPITAFGSVEMPATAGP